MPWGQTIEMFGNCLVHDWETLDSFETRQASTRVTVISDVVRESDSVQ